MSTLSEINAILASIKTDLDQIDLTKEKDVNKIQAMGQKPIKEVDSATKRADFGEEHLEYVVNEFKKTSDRLETYDNSVDREEAKRANGDMAKIQAISDRMNAKKAVQVAIKAKYEELSRKKEVIDKYKEKYDPEYLIGKQNDRLEANKQKIEANKAKMAKLESFKNSVSGELGTINHNLALIEELKKLEELQQAVKKMETTLSQYKASNFNPDLIADQENALNEAKAGLSTKANEITKKYKGVVLDTNDLTTSIPKAKGVAEANIITAKIGIINKAKLSSEEYIKKDIKQKLENASKGDIKEFVSVIDNEYSALGAENINLGIVNEKISRGVETIRLGEKVRTDTVTSTTTTIAEPTEAEITKYLEDHPDVRALAPALTLEAERQKTYNWLVRGKSFFPDVKFLHPIAALRARFDKGARNSWQASYEREMRNKAVEGIKAERQAESETRAQAVELSESKQTSFKKALFAKVMKSTDAQVQQMGQDADKAPGGVLVDVYNQMEAEEEAEK